MYLKRLEIDGFKSFASETSLDFTKGITAIVGPNGSGKSNILDAILWVLGEQSYKSIRAKESSDVIFSGGKYKNARTTAKVSLIIDNKDRYLELDEDEISITRAINSDLESKYLINNQPVRLKDINSLLMDTGIGKNAYSVIGQGKVERIVSSSPIEIRNIIDEAAGIKKAKSEKESANKKLNGVEQEIEKIDFVVVDLERRLKSLEIESKNARTYLAYTKENEVLKYLKYKYNIDVLNEKIKENKIQSEKENKKLDEINNILDNINSKLKEYDDEKIELENQLDILSKMNYDTNFVENLEKQKNELIENKTEFLAQAKLNEQNYTQMLEDVNNLDNAIKTNKTEFLKCSEALKDVINKREKLEKEKESNEENYNLLENENTQILMNLKNYEVDKYKLKTEIEENIKRINQAQKRNESIKKEISQTNIELEDLKKDNKTEYINELRNNDKKLVKSLNELKNGKYKYEQKYEEINSKYIAIKSSIDNLTASNDAVKFIHNNSKNDTQVLGPLISMIDVEKEYNLAISIIAGFNFYDIVVETSEVANKYINMLKNNKIGQASFLPLDNLKIRQLNNTIYENSVYARDKVKNNTNNPKIDDVIKYIFSNTIITDDMQQAIKISKICKEKIITKLGDQISSTGRISGGYITKTVNNVLIKKNELETLEKEKEKLQELISINEKELSKISAEYFENKKKLEEVETVYSKYESKFKDLNNQLETFEFEIDDNNNFINNKNKVNESNQILIDTIDDKILQENEKQKDNIKKIEEIKKILSDVDELNKLNIDFAVIKNKSEDLSKIINEKNTEYDSKKQKLDDLIEFNATKDEIIKKYDVDINNINNQIIEYRENSIKSKDKISNLTKQIITNSEKNKKLLNEKTDIEVQKTNLINNITNLNSQNDEYNTNLSNNISNFEQLKENEKEILSSYHYSAITNDIELRNIEKRININEKSRIALGEVNLSAIKMYDEDKKVYNELCNSKFDLIKSRDKIKVLIDEIDLDITEKFGLAISSIRDNFSNLCSKLMNGAKGKITLENEDDLINTGLDISIKYKNKPVQSLTLLSGGEKSMLAISFMIAIFMYKPTPFTFFDEVEAALDDANTKKIISLLKEFNNSQFILITHNKETMKGADRLYGVTMNKEIGHSVLVSVDI